ELKFKHFSAQDSSKFFIRSRCDFCLHTAKKKALRKEPRELQNRHTTIFLPTLSTRAEVANLALPFAQFLRPEICSAINFDSGTSSVRTEAMVRSVGSF